jgi:hypothetical protein
MSTGDPGNSNSLRFVVFPAEELRIDGITSGNGFAVLSRTVLFHENMILTIPRTERESEP